ncbi:MAG: WYL domain-containing protein [Erysipelotrichaceae bacterium]|nr:WYL domain-containing protein [Erysipelotrichaceae bacterium]
MASENKTKVNKSNCLRLLYVKEIIFEHSDEEHLLSTNEIIDMLHNEYHISVTRQTLTADIDMLIDAGYDIECIKSNPNKYHILSREFDIAELRILIDSIESLRSLPVCKAKELTKKLARLGGPSVDLLLETINVESIPRSDNSQIYYIIDAILKAKAEGKQISFKYYEYNTSNKSVLKNNGRDYIVSPYQLVCSNDYYYLLGYSVKHEKTTAFRVDRICGIPEVIDMDSVFEPENINAKEYIRESYHMMSGDEAKVTLRFDSSVIDAMIDRFGQDLDITFLHKKECEARVIVPVNNVFFAWLFGFDGKVMISGPNKVKDQYIRLVSKAMARL